MKFVFKKRFKFEEYPEILKCRNEYNRIVDHSYEMEANYDNGHCSKEEFYKTMDACNDYFWNEYARAVFNEFYGKGLSIKDWRTKAIVKFDDQFKAPFESINNDDRQILACLVHIKFGWKLPAKYYTNKPFPVD